MFTSIYAESFLCSKNERLRTRIRLGEHAAGDGCEVHRFWYNSNRRHSGLQTDANKSTTSIWNSVSTLKYPQIAVRKARAITSGWASQSHNKEPFRSAVNSRAPLEHFRTSTARPRPPGRNGSTGCFCGSA